VLYKTLADGGQSGLGRSDTFVALLPTLDGPGGWVEVPGPLGVNVNALAGDNGIHLATRKWIVRYLCEDIYEAEYEGEIKRESRYLIARKVRLKRKFANWNARTARLFAADCADRVLDFYFRAYPGDPRPNNAIQLARQVANEVIGPNAPQVAAVNQAAFQALEEAADHTPAKSAALAAFSCLNVDQSAASAARETAQAAIAAVKARRLDWESVVTRRPNRKKEMAWQTNRLIRILHGPLPHGY